MNRRFWALVTALVVSTAAQAQEEHTVRRSGGGPTWSALSGETVGLNNNVLLIEAGFPGIPITYLHGAANNVDFGFRFTFNYGLEGDTQLTYPGVKLQGIVRVKLVDMPRVKFGFSFEPGFLSYFPGNGRNAIVGFALPVNFVAGIPITSALMLNAGIDFPMWIAFTDYSSFQLPIGFGGGVEYFLNSDVALTFNLRMGPIIYTAPGFTDFGLKALVGVAFRI